MTDSGAYWRKLKQRLVKENSEVVTFCHGLKLVAPDGKNHNGYSQSDHFADIGKMIDIGSGVQRQVQNICDI